MPLHDQALQLAKEYQRLEGELLLVLEEIQNKKIFLEQGYGSLFEYMVKALNLAESTAYSLQTVLRKAKEVPELKKVIQTGELSLGKAKRIAPLLTPSNFQKWVEVAKISSSRELDKQVANQSPKTLIQERLIPKAQDRNELRLGVSDAFEAKLKKAQDLVSQQQRSSVTLEITLEEALNVLLEKFSARRKECAKTTAFHSSIDSNLENESQKNQSLKRPTPDHASSPSAQDQPENKNLTAKTKRLVLERDSHRCHHINARGERCTQTRFLDIHHLIQRARGGKHELENLITLCSTHHRWLHSTNLNST